MVSALTFSFVALAVASCRHPRNALVGAAIDAWSAAKASAEAPSNATIAPLPRQMMNIPTMTLF